MEVSDGTSIKRWLITGKYQNAYWKTSKYSLKIYVADNPQVDCGASVAEPQSIRMFLADNPQ